MKKTLIAALCCIVALVAACKKKPVDPEPEPQNVNYAEQYVGNYIGQFTLIIATMNNEPATSMSFPIDGITMDIAKGEQDNTVTATVTVDNESHQTAGTATADKVDFENVHLKIDKPDQQYAFDLNLKMESVKPTSDSLRVTGTFSGNGLFAFMGQMNILDEVSGTISGKLAKPQQ